MELIKYKVVEPFCIGKLTFLEGSVLYTTPPYKGLIPYRRLTLRKMYREDGSYIDLFLDDSIPLDKLSLLK